MTNPNNIVRVRARNGGRASVYEANGWAQMLTQGLLEGNGVIQNTSADMNVLVGGTNTNPDVLVAQNPAGYKIALDIVGQQAIAITAPASGSRITSIVAYTDDLSLSTTEDTVTGSPNTCGLITVNGDSASSPIAPDDAAIRSAITADGATGSQACYVVIANVTVASTTTTITNTLIDNQRATVQPNQFGDGSITQEKLDFTTYDEVGVPRRIGTWIDGKPLYRKIGTITFTSTASEGPYQSGDLIDDHISHGAITRVFVDGTSASIGQTGAYIGGRGSTIQTNIYIEGGSSNHGKLFGFTTNSSFLNKPFYVVCEYTKTTD